VALLFAVFAIYTLAFCAKSLAPRSFLTQIAMFAFGVVFVLLSLLGAHPVEHPYLTSGQLLAFAYFVLLFGFVGNSHLYYQLYRPD